VFATSKQLSQGDDSIKQFRAQLNHACCKLDRFVIVTIFSICLKNCLDYKSIFSLKSYRICSSGLYYKRFMIVNLRS
jgi:hypothetical protein